MRNSKAIVVASIFIAQLIFLSYIYYGDSTQEIDNILSGWFLNKSEMGQNSYGSLLQFIISGFIYLGFSSYMKLRFLLEILNVIGLILIYLALRKSEKPITISLFIIVIALATPIFNGHMWLAGSLLSVPLFILAYFTLWSKEGLSKSHINLLILISVYCVLIEPIVIVNILSFWAIYNTRIDGSRKKKVIGLFSSLMITFIGLWIINGYEIIDYKKQFNNDPMDILLIILILLILIYVVIAYHNNLRVRALAYLCIACSFVITGQIPALSLFVGFSFVKRLFNLLQRIRSVQRMTNWGIAVIFSILIGYSVIYYSASPSTEILNESKYTKIIKALTNTEDRIYSETYPYLYLSAKRLPIGGKIDHESKQIPKMIIYRKEGYSNEAMNQLLDSKYEQIDGGKSILKDIYVQKNNLNESLNVLNQLGMYSIHPMAQSDSSSTVGEITKDTSIIQSFTVFMDRFNGIELSLATFGRKNEGEITFVLKDTSNNVIIEVKENTEALNDNAGYLLSFPTIQSSRNKQYILEISSDSPEEKAITIYSSIEDLYPHGELHINGIKQTGDLTFRVLTE